MFISIHTGLGLLKSIPGINLAARNEEMKTKRVSCNLILGEAFDEEKKTELVIVIQMERTVHEALELFWFYAIFSRDLASRHHGVGFSQKMSELVVSLMDSSHGDKCILIVKRRTRNGKQPSTSF